MRSGRVKIAAANTKTIIYVPNGGNQAIRYYRVYNSGKNKTENITVSGAANGANIAIPPYESIDFGVKNDDIEVTAGATEEAEVVYDYLG